MDGSEDALEHPVIPRVLSPKTIARRQAAAEFGIGLPLGCPICGSPRVQAILFGMPAPGMEAVANAVTLGGCEIFDENATQPFTASTATTQTERRPECPPAEVPLPSGRLDP